MGIEGNNSSSMEIPIHRSTIKKLEDTIFDLAFETEPEKVKRLAWTFGLLGQLYIEVAGEYIKDGKKTEAANSYNEAALFYNYVISMIKKNEDLKDLNERIKPYDQLDFIQRKLVKCLGGHEDKLEKFDPEKFTPYTLLTKLRRKVAEEIECLDKKTETYIEKSRKLFQDIAEGMREFLAQLYQKAEEVIGTAPCKYAIIGLGSMALKQMTPYSDLEFAILIEDQKDKLKNQTHKDYFKNISQLVHFYVINLGETVMPMSKYKCDLSYLVKRGVNFDLGGKTPLGRNDKPYELICTVDEMLEYMYNKDKKSEHIDKNLPYILQKTCFVHGSRDLFDEYDGKVKEFLKVHGESRAIKMLWEGCVEIDYVDYSRREYKTEGNISQFALHSHDLKGRIFNIKTEIYRLPDRLIYNLGLIYGIDGEDNWDTITKLAEQEKINKIAETNLKRALTFATLLRLKAYSHYGYQKEEMEYDEKYDDLDQEEREKLIKKDMVVQTFKLSDEDLQEDGELYKYYYVTRPLTWKLAEFCKSHQNDLLSEEEKGDYFREEEFYDESASVKGDINLRFLNIESARQNQELALQKLIDRYGEGNPLLGFKYNMLGLTYSASGNFEKAIKYFKKAEKTAISESSLCIVYNNLGIVYGEKGEYEESNKYFKKSLEKQETSPSFSESNPTELYVQTCANFGASLSEQCKLGESLKYIEKSLRMSEQMFGKYHPLTGSCYFSYGVVLYHLQRIDDALHHLDESLNIRKKLFSKNDPMAALIYYHKGEAYRSKNQDEDAEKNYREGLKICSNGNFLNAARCYNGLALVYKNRRQYKEALEFCDDALKLRQERLGQDHPETASSYITKAGIQNELGQYWEALISGNYALNIMKKINLNQEHEYIEEANCIMGSVLFALHKPDQAVPYVQEALRSNEKRYNKEDNPTAYGYRIAIWKFERKYVEALDACTKVLKIHLKEKNFRYAADNCMGMASIFEMLKYVSKAKILGVIAEKIRKKEKHFYLREWGETDNKTAGITVAIAPDLYWISQHVGKEYSKVKKKIEKICGKYKDKSDQKIAKMLCFEAICIGVANSNNTHRFLGCLKKFCQENLDLVIEIAERHPEYFVEEKIIGECIKNFPTKFKSLEILLQKQKLP